MKQAGGETLYLKVDRNVQVHDKKVTIGDLAQILCTDKQTENLVKTIKVPQATNGKPGRHTMSVMELIERIQEEVSGLEINNIGEYDFLVTYEVEKQPGRVLSYAKTIFVAALSFFGAAFTIMTFNNDVDIPKLFAQIYQQFTGITVQWFYGYGVLVLDWAGAWDTALFQPFRRQKDHGRSDTSGSGDAYLRR